MAGNSALQEKLRLGIEAARKGDKLNAQKLLRQVTAGDSNNEVAWMWLASVSETLQERRACLEQTLRINPGNTRARQALEQLSSVTGVPIRTASGRVAAPSRRPAAAVGNRSANTRAINPAYLIVAVLALLALLTALIFSAISNSQPQPPSPATIEAAALVLETATPTATINPRDYTATPFFGVIVTPANLATLPPSFTPTNTDTPTFTPPPTQTPFPIAQFSLLYTDAASGDSQAALYSSNADGTGELSIGPGSAGFADAVYSPDGKKIAFVRNVVNGDVTSPELFIAPADKLDTATQVTKIGGKKLEHPTFAPDGIQIVFVSDISGNDDLWYITEDGNNQRQLTTNPGIDKDPAWSPTGEKITFVSDRNGDGDIFMTNGDGQLPLLLTVDDNNAEDRNPIFTPDGKSVLFLSNRDNDTFQVYVVDIETLVVTRLTDKIRDIASVVFKPIPLAVFVGSS